MIAKDSPLLIDCPPAKSGESPSTHSSLDAAIAKFRMTAYMWQALTAEDLRAKRLGRRSFRLEEEWATDTLSQRSLHSPTTASVPKIHLIRTEKTVAELRDANNNKDDLHAIFTAALHAHGAPFTTQAHPVVAGLILDAHYDATNTKLVLAHAALGTHDPAGLSLGVFGSHLTYAWPRFLEEVPDCLLKHIPAGDTVANDDGECGTPWQACAVGQGAFLREVGHAFGALGTEGIMRRENLQDWPKALLGCARTPGKGLGPVTPKTWHYCEWDEVDALRLRVSRHFWMPGDAEVSKEPPTVRVDDGGDEEEVERLYLELKSEAGLARVLFCQDWKTNRDYSVSTDAPVKSVRYLRGDLETYYGADILGLEVTDVNGMQCIINDIWPLFKGRSCLPVPGTDIRLIKQSISYVCARDGVDEDSDRHWQWAVMLRKRDSNGDLVDASNIDLYVGGSLDGAIVHYKDGTQIPCGPRGPNGDDPEMCAHQARRIAIPEGVEVSKVAVTREKDSGELVGLRMWLSNGKAMGALNCTLSNSAVELLTPPSNHKIIGFYGTSDSGMCEEFGIVSVSRDAILPDSVYDMRELQNKPEEDGQGNKRSPVELEHDSDEEMSSINDEDPSEDEDDGYDDYEGGCGPEVERMYRG